MIKSRRQELGLTQEELAGMAGISCRTLQRLESGGSASAETLKCIAAALDVEFASLHAAQRGEARSAEYASADFDTQAVSAAELEQAREHVREMRSFYNHAMQYGVVIFALACLNLMTSPDYLWFLWPALGWGVGIVAHGMSVFEIFPFLDAKWEERQVAKHLRRN
ncbi:MAG: helix-turn-helix domain-containing protein [Pseudomonadota bacterium]